jgi:hypothetical protein
VDIGSGVESSDQDIKILVILVSGHAEKVIYFRVSFCLYYIFLVALEPYVRRQSSFIMLRL